MICAAKLSDLQRCPAMAVILLALAACSGGGDGQTAGIDRGGVRTPITVSGAISGFGSTIVGGVRYDSGGAAVIVDEAQAIEDDLAVGQIVHLVGETEMGSSTASSIVLVHEVVGPVDAIDLSTRTLLVLGQVVRADADTSFSTSFTPQSLEGVGEGEYVAVSGLRDSGGTLFAGRVERHDGQFLRVQGEIRAVDTAVRRLEINSLSVDYSTAMIDGFASGQPQVGDYVRVLGSAFDGSGRLVAMDLQQRARSPLAGTFGIAMSAVLEGFVTRFVSPADFDVDGQRAAVDGATQFLNGTIDDLGIDVRLRLAGQLDSQGWLAVTEVRFRRPGVLRIEATVQGVDAVADTIEVLGTAIRLEPEFRILGFRVLTDANTEFDDMSRDEFFAESAGRLVDVDGTLVGDTVLADEIEWSEGDGDEDDD
jgi:hypothetical protein